MASQAAQQFVNRKALVFYRDHLIAEHDNRQAGLARNGKARATTKDDERNTALESELGAIDALLRRQSPYGLLPVSGSAVLTAQSQPVNVFQTQVMKDEEPYINPFTGVLVVPRKSNAPGPSKSERRASIHNNSLHISTRTPLSPLNSSNHSKEILAKTPSEEPNSCFLDISSATNEGTISSVGKIERQRKRLPSPPDTENAARISLWNSAVAAAVSSVVLDKPSDERTLPTKAESHNRGSLVNSTHDCLQLIEGVTSPRISDKHRNSRPTASSSQSSTVSSLTTSLDTGASTSDKAEICEPVTDPSSTAGKPSFTGSTQHNSSVRRKPVPVKGQSTAVILLSTKHDGVFRDSTFPPASTDTSKCFATISLPEVIQESCDSTFEPKIPGMWPRDQSWYEPVWFTPDLRERRQHERARRGGMVQEFQQQLKRDRQQWEKDSLRLSEQLRQREERLKREQDMQRKRAEKSHRLREAVERKLEEEGRRKREEERRSQEAALQNLEAARRKFNEYLRIQDEARRKQREAQEHASEALARQLQEAFDREDAMTAESETFARKLQEEWNAELTPPTEQYIPHDPPPTHRRRHPRRRPSPTPPSTTASTSRNLSSTTRPLTTCTVCLTSLPTSTLIRLPCTHPYCAACLTSALTASLSSTPPRPFTCCPAHPPLPLPLAVPFLATTALRAAYAAALATSSDPRPLYCAHGSCNAYILTSSRKGGIGTCGKCARNTCASCRKVAHGGLCKEDEAERRLGEVARKMGWRGCPRCGALVEKVLGCAHVSCRCGGEFCYGCGGVWGSCVGVCPGR